METNWINYAKKHLLGRKIVDVRYLTQKEADNMGWNSRPLVIFFENGTYLFPSMDDEGNDGGALFGNTKDGQDLTFPVL